MNHEMSFENKKGESPELLLAHINQVVEETSVEHMTEDAARENLGRLYEAFNEATKLHSQMKGVEEAKQNITAAIEKIKNLFPQLISNFNIEDYEKSLNDDLEQDLKEMTK